MDAFRTLLHGGKRDAAYYQSLTQFLLQALADTAAARRSLNPLSWNPFTSWTVALIPVDTSTEVAKAIADQCDDVDDKRLESVCDPWMSYFSYTFLSQELTDVATSHSAIARNTVLRLLRETLNIRGSREPLLEDYRDKLKDLLGQRYDDKIDELIQRVYHGDDGSDDFEGSS